MLAEYDGSNNLQRYFIYGNYIDEPLLMVDTTGQSDVDYYYAQDHLYSSAALIEDDGDVIERYEYDAYGNVHIMDGNYNSRSSTLYANPYTFTGRRKHNRRWRKQARTVFKMVRALTVSDLPNTHLLHLSEIVPLHGRVGVR